MKIISINSRNKGEGWHFTKMFQNASYSMHAYIHTYVCTCIQRKFSTQQTQSKCATQHLMQAKRFEKVLEATGHCTAHSYCAYSGKSHLAAEW